VLNVVVHEALYGSSKICVRAKNETDGVILFGYFYWILASCDSKVTHSYLIFTMFV